MSDAAIQQKLAAMFAANKDEVSVPKIYIDMTGGWETGAVLDEIMFWTLPKKNTGRTSLRVFRDHKLWLAVRRAEWWERKRLTERQADTAIGKLITQGLIEKDVFLFDGKPTVHLRLITSKFAALYAEKLRGFAVQEDDENLIRDIADLYSMMGFPPENVISNLQNGEMLNLQNGEIINSPLQPEKTTREIPQNMPIEWYVQHDLPVPPELIKNNAAEAEAIHEFESAFGFNQLPWDTTSDWQAFKKWVVKIYQSAPADFRDYVEWRDGKGKYDAMSNKQIRLTPRAFMDTGYPTFKASAMYAKKTDEVRPEYKPYKPEERNYVPRPATIKPVIRKPAE